MYILTRTLKAKVDSESGSPGSGRFSHLQKYSAKIDIANQKNRFSMETGFSADYSAVDGTP